MPFYEYRCSACGHELEVLQKMSDKLLVDCPSCGKATLSKLVSAAGFQLKGSGWYVTDFRDGNKGKKDKDDSKPKDDAKAETGEVKSESGATASSDSGTAAKGDKSGESSAASKKDDSNSRETSGTDKNRKTSSGTTSK